MRRELRLPQAHDHLHHCADDDLDPGHHFQFDRPGVFHDDFVGDAFHDRDDDDHVDDDDHRRLSREGR
jgi:hypothetical protein